MTTNNYLTPIYRRSYSILFFTLLLFILTGCGEKREQTESTAEIALFVPGILAENPSFTMMYEGTKRAADKSGLNVIIIEGGYDQQQWKDQMTALAAEGHYTLIVTTGPAMIEICSAAGKNSPDQQFLCLDGFYSGELKIASYRFNHRELAFLLGYFAGLITSSEMEFANKQIKIGLIAGVDDQQMEKEIRPGFEIGFRTVHPEGIIDFRVAENQDDIEGASTLAQSMISEGVDIIMPIAGKANQGVVTAAEEWGAYVLWYDSPGFNRKPGTAVGSGKISLDLATESMIQKILSEKSESFITEEGHVFSGILDFLDTEKHYLKGVPEEVRNSMNTLMTRTREGSFSLPFSN